MYHLVIVVELQNNFRGALSNVLGVSENLDVIEDQSLIPGRVQCCPQLLCSLTNMQEGDVCIWICKEEEKTHTWFNGRLSTSIISARS